MNPNLKKKPRHKWFSAPDRQCEDGWYGPHDTIEKAIEECFCQYGSEYPAIYVTQGHKLTKSEREEYGAEYDWEVDSINALEIKLPTPQHNQR